MNRRRLILIAGGAAALPGGLYLWLSDSPPAPGFVWASLPPDLGEAATLLIDAVIPDEALAADVPAFIDRRLALDASLAEFYRAGLDRLTRDFGRPIAGSPAADRIAFFERIVAGPDRFPIEFLTQLAYDTFEGFYTHSRGWALSGYAGPCAQPDYDRAP